MDGLSSVRSHHERWDGLGYPDGLKGEGNPRLVRNVADAFVAMTHDSPCRKGLPAEQAFAEVEQCQGKQLDPQCAAAFLAIRRRVELEMQSETTQIGGTPMPPPRRVTSWLIRTGSKGGSDRPGTAGPRLLGRHRSGRRVRRPIRERPPVEFPRPAIADA
jgi:hypothetical protein